MSTTLGSNQRSTTLAGRITKNRSSNLQNLRNRLQLIKRSHYADSPRQSIINRTGSASHGPTSLLHSIPDDVVLNFTNMDRELGLRPAEPSKEPLSLPPLSQGRSRNRLVDALGETHSRLTVDDKGQFRYFGYSSSMRVVSVLPQPSTQNSSPPLCQNVVDDVEGRTLADSPETQTSLIDMFFKYQNAAIPILDEEVFRAGHARGVRSEYYSKFLLYSLLLRALKFSDLSRTDILAMIYLQRARAELLFEIENPTISTIPAMCLFGSYLAGMGSDRACWLYPGMAYRLIFDFGLHEDCKNLIDAGLLTEIDQRVRQSTLYGCYVLDKLYSSFQGRPTTIRLEDITAARPSIHAPNQKLMTAWVDLASLLDGVISIINGPREKIYQDSSVKMLSETCQSLLQWSVNLPTELQWNPTRPPSPEICSIHIQFLSTIILLNRPFAAYMFTGHKRTYFKRCLAGQTPEVSQQICTANAIRISKLLLTYRRHFGPGKIFATINPSCLLAAMALISDIVSVTQGQDKGNERKSLAIIIETLEEITPSYPVAGRSRNTLAAIMNTCGLADLLRGPPPESHAEVQLEHAQDRSTSDWRIGDDPSFSLQFDPAAFDVHDINLMDFYSQPLQPLDFENRAANDLFIGGLGENLNSNEGGQGIGYTCL